MRTTPLHVVIPVKNSPESTIQTIEAVMNSKYKKDFELTVYDDFSDKETADLLDKTALKYSFEVVHLSDVTTNPSPNYRLILQIAQSKAINSGAHVLIVESDVTVKEDTISKLYESALNLNNPGIIAAVTTDENDKINYPYLFASDFEIGVISVNKHLSFCCTLLSNAMLNSYDFNKLNPEKSWYDVFVSHKSIEMGYINYLDTSCRVIHKPHSSRPWKKLKYKNPFLYYFRKLFKGLDKI
ncbi:MAG: glycosyltransferase family A protein [Fermentimonas sp.]|nr:glycosyltransferase family A protein [Fermentimonas sp.]